MIFLIHPFMFFLIAAIGFCILSHSIRRFFQLLIPFFVLFLFFNLKKNMDSLESYFYGIHFLKIDALSTLFMYVFLFFCFVANLYSFHNKSKMIAIFSMLYMGSSVGAVLAGDLMGLFIFWELMVITSCILIYNSSRKNSLPALFRYFLVHLTGGLFFFSGLMIKIFEGQSLALEKLALDPAGILIFLGFAVNAGIPPFHSWVADAYPEGTPEGSTYLSAFTTKVAVYVFARCFVGEEVLIYLGAIAAIYGVIYALLENDMRRLLSYHIICQIGYMLCAIGIGSHLGVNSGVGHAVGNILFKGLLFMATGTLIYMTGYSKLSDLGNMLRHSKVLFIFYMVGAFAISGFPGFNGYVTKSLLGDAVAHEHITWLKYVMTFVGAGTFLSIGLKLAYFAFIAPATAVHQEIKKVPWNMSWAMALLSLACIVLGVYPQILFGVLPYEVHENPFTKSHIIHQLELLFGTLLGFLLILKKLHAKDTLTLDMDIIYRKGCSFFVGYFCSGIRMAQEKVQGSYSKGVQLLGEKASALSLKEKMGPLYQIFFLMALASLVILIFLLF